MNKYAKDDAHLTRRGFLKAAGITLFAAAGVASLNGYASGPQTATSTMVSSGASPASTGPVEAKGDGQAGSLVLVFSRADENYEVGTVSTGNTMVLAQMIAESTGADLFELQRVDDYPPSYAACCDEAKAEQAQNARPALKGLPDLSAYDTVYLGTPVWWGELPMPVFTAIESLDWQGKAIAPFSTHAGSGGSGVFKQIADGCAGAAVRDGLAIEGKVAQNDRDSARASIESWLRALGY